VNEHRNGWPVKKLGDICAAIQYGYTESSTLEQVGPKFLRITDIQNGKVDWNAVPYCKCDDFEKYRLQPGDILFARTGATTGKSFLIRDCPESIFASYLIRVQLSNEVLPAYLYQFFQTPIYWSHISQFTTGSTQGGFNASKLAEITVPLPPLPIQKQIAAILEKADAAREKRRQANQLTEQFLQSAFLEMFGDPITNPKGWETGNLGLVADVKSGFAFRSQDYHDNGIRLVRISNFNGSSLEFNDDSIWVTTKFSEEYAEFLLKENDVLIAMSGATTGKLGFVQKKDLPCLLNQRVGRFAITEPQKMVPHYLFHFLSRPLVKKRILDLAGGSAQPNVSPTQLKELDIPLPPISEQQKFAALVEQVESLRAKQRKSEKELEKLFGSLMQRAFKGDLIS